VSIPDPNRGRKKKGQSLVIGPKQMLEKGGASSAPVPEGGKKKKAIECSGAGPEGTGKRPFHGLSLEAGKGAGLRLPTLSENRWARFVP